MPAQPAERPLMANHAVQQAPAIVRQAMTSCVPPWLQTRQAGPTMAYSRVNFQA